MSTFAGIPEWQTVSVVMFVVIAAAAGGAMLMLAWVLRPVRGRRGRARTRS